MKPLAMLVQVMRLSAGAGACRMKLAKRAMDETGGGVGVLVLETRWCPRRPAAPGHVPMGQTGTLPAKNKSELILPSSIAVQAK